LSRKVKSDKSTLPMDISLLGHSSFKIKGRKVTLLTDPYDPEKTGLKFPKAEADIITVSHPHYDHSHTSLVGGNPVTISGPGEYEVKGVKIIGISSFHDAVKGAERGKNTIYQIEMDKMTLVHLGDLGHKLDEAAVEILNGADILMIPVGGVYTINSVVAAQVITQLEPSIIIPMHYWKAGMNKEKFGELSDISFFLKEMGKESIQPVVKLSVTKDKIPAEATITVLE